MLLGEIEVLKKAQIKVGRIFRMEFYPKDAEGNYVGVSLINTNVNINFAHVIAPFQHCIYPEKYEFLKGQYRYVDCYSIRDIEEIRIAENAEYIGYLDEADLTQVYSLLKESPAIDRRTMKRYGLE